MKKRFIIVVLDSFGVGEMDDVKVVRRSDIGANTAKHILENNDIKIDTLCSLGLINALNVEVSNYKANPYANYGVANLAHFGGDTFFGHQEIMGTKPELPLTQKFSENIEKTADDLILSGFSVRKYTLENTSALIVNECAIIGDNMETDLGQAINVSGTFDKISFDDIVKIGKIVRLNYKVPRIIALGGENVSLSEIIDSCFTKGGFIGIDTPKSNLYKSGYKVVHIGYGVDFSLQLPNILHNKNIKTYLYGKVADIVNNVHGRSIYGVDTAALFESLLEDLSCENAFFCLNVQETDLAGHQQDGKTYAKTLEIADSYLKKIIEKLNVNDVLIVMADHGNDPYIGHSKHTREKVPLLIYKRGLRNVFVGNRETLADVGETCADFYGCELKFGTSFLNKLV